MAVKTKKSIKKISKKSTKSNTQIKPSVVPNIDEYQKPPAIVPAKVGQSELDRVISQVPADQKDKLIGIKDSIEKFKDKIINRLPGYVMGISLLPPPKPEDLKDEDGKPIDPKTVEDQINVLLLIDDMDAKRLSKEEISEKIQKTADEMAASVDKNLKIQTVLITEVWQQCYDSKPEILQMIAMSAIVYDTGMLQAIKIAEVHKSNVVNRVDFYGVPRVYRKETDKSYTFEELVDSCLGHFAVTTHGGALVQNMPRPFRGAHPPPR